MQAPCSTTGQGAATNIRWRKGWTLTCWPCGQGRNSQWCSPEQQVIKHASREAPRLPAQSACIRPIRGHHRVFLEQLFYVGRISVLHILSTQSRNRTRLIRWLGEGTGVTYQRGTYRRLPQEGTRRVRRPLSGYTDRSFRAEGRHDRPPWLVGWAVSWGQGQWGSPGSPVVCLATFLAVSPPFLPLLPAQRFYEPPKNLSNNSLSSFSLKLARAFCCSWAGKLTKTALRANSLNSSEKMVPCCLP